MTERFDPVLLSVLANAFDGIVREMTNGLLRSARSSVINTARDFSCSILTAQNELLASAEGCPVHVFGSEPLGEAMAELHDDLAPGDAFLHNDPYRGNSHAADHAILVPIFAAGEHVFTAVAKAHQADCGNSLPTTFYATARDVYEEGALIFPCVRIQRGYEDVADIVRMCRARIRVPDQWYGDYLATVGAARIAERRVQELAERHGVDTLRRFTGEWFAYSERLVTSVISRLPAVTLHGSTVHDPFPGTPEAGLALGATVIVAPAEGRIAIDLRDNPDNLPNGLNLTAPRPPRRRWPACSAPPRTTSQRTPAPSVASMCGCATAASSASRGSRTRARPAPRTSPTGSSGWCRPRSPRSATSTARPRAASARRRARA